MGLMQILTERNGLLQVKRMNETNVDVCVKV